MAAPLTIYISKFHLTGIEINAQIDTFRVTNSVFGNEWAEKRQLAVKIENKS